MGESQRGPPGKVTRQLSLKEQEEEGEEEEGEGGRKGRGDTWTEREGCAWHRWKDERTLDVRVLQSIRCQKQKDHMPLRKFPYAFSFWQNIQNKIQHHNHFKVYISVAFSAFTMLYSHHYRLVEHALLKQGNDTIGLFCPRRTLLEGGWVCRTARRHGGELDEAEGKRDR